VTSCPRPSVSAQTSSWPTAPTSPCYFSAVLRSLPAGTPSVQQQRIHDCGQQRCLLFDHIQTLIQTYKNCFFNLSKLNVVGMVHTEHLRWFSRTSKELLCVFHDLSGPCTACRSTSSLTRSMISSWHIVMQHCTNYYVV